MRPAPRYEFSEEQDIALKKARRLEYLTLGYLASVIALMYVVMGSSQAMKTAWIEDCLSLIPPLCFLVGTRICWRNPTKHYPYGFHRVISILFLCASLALLFMGAYLLLDSLHKLFVRAHPTVGMKEFFGHDMWLGWWMVIVLIWGTFPPVFLGRAKIKHAEKLNDKILVADGKMNKADWLTAAAAIGGVLGIGMGWWWADAVAAAFISLDILKDGWTQTADAVTGLINRAPTSVHNKYIDLPEKAQQALQDYGWVKKAQVRLYEHGHLIYGEGFIASDDDVSVEQIEDATEKIRALDWRLQSFVITVLRKELF